MKKIMTTALAIVMGISLIACAESEEIPTDSTGNGNGNYGTINGSFSVDSVDGLNSGRIPTGGSATLYVRLSNSAGVDIGGITNGLRVYSPDGARWGAVVPDTTGVLGEEDFDLVWKILQFGVTGAGADTVGFAGSVMTGAGMTDGFDGIVYTLTIGPIPSGYTNKTVCVDSCFFPPAGTWLWAGDDQISGKPSWDGPHCYPIGPSKTEE
jgi:hypothetical protein